MKTKRWKISCPIIYTTIQSLKVGKILFLIKKKKEKKWMLLFSKVVITGQGSDHKEQQNILSIWFVSVLCCITRNINIQTGCNISPSCWTDKFLVAGNLEHSIMHQPPRYIQTMKTKKTWTSASDDGNPWALVTILSTYGHISQKSSTLFRCYVSTC